MIVVVTFKLSNPSTSKLEVEVLTVTLGTPGMVGAAEIATAEAMRVMREARGEEENIVKVVRTAEETTSMKP